MEIVPEDRDNTIIDLFWERNEAALELTAKHYGRFVFLVCYNILRQKQDSEECQSTTYMKTWDRIPPERPKSLKAFLARVARATSIDHLRGKTRLKRNRGFVESLDDYSEFLSDDCSVSDELEAKELAAILNRFLSSLKDSEQICFVKRYYFNIPVNEISREMRIPRSTVYAMLDSIKTRLKILLKEEGYL